MNAFGLEITVSKSRVRITQCHPLAVGVSIICRVLSLPVGISASFLSIVGTQGQELYLREDVGISKAGHFFAKIIKKGNTAPAPCVGIQEAVFKDDHF